jgi:hypothetical protein
VRGELAVEFGKKRHAIGETKLGAGPHNPHRMELSGTTGSETWFRARESVAFQTQVNRNSSQDLGVYHKAMRRPEDRRIFTIGQDE